MTNVALPHMQGSLSAGVEEMAWVITSFLAANAIIILATGWLSGLVGRRRFFLICTVLFTVSSFLSGIAPNLTFLVLARVFQGLGGGPVIPISQAILGPTLGGWIADNWSWRWIFYRALAMLDRDTVGQAQVLAYADEFWLFALVFFGLLAVLPFMRRVRAEPAPPPGAPRPERVEPLPAPTD